MAARRKEIVYRRNDMVLVARTKGGWSPAVVTAVNEEKKEYAVYFSDQKGRNVCKQISFAAAQVHMKPDDPNAGSEEERARLLESKHKLEEMQRFNFYHMSQEDQRSIDIVCGYVQKSSCSVQEACQKYVASVPGASALAPRAQSELGYYSTAIEDLIAFLIANPGRGPVMTYHDIAQWAASRDGTVAEAFASQAPASAAAPVLVAPPPAPSVHSASRQPSQPVSRHESVSEAAAAPAPVAREHSAVSAAREPSPLSDVDAVESRKRAESTASSKPAAESTKSDAAPIADVRLPTPPPHHGADEPGTPSPPHKPTPAKEELEVEAEVEEPLPESVQGTPAVATDESWPDIGRMIDEVDGLDKTIHEMGQVGSPSDDDLQKRDEAIKQRVALLRALADRFDKMEGEDVAVPFEYEEKVADIFGNVMARGDMEEGSSDFTGALLKRINPACLLEVLDERNLFCEAVGDGSVVFLTQLLGDTRLHSVNAFDIPEIVAGSCYSQSTRIPLVEVCLKHLNLKPVADEVSSVMDEFLHAVLDDSKAFPREDRSALATVVESILSLDFLDIDTDSTDSTGKTMFSKICASGSLPLLTLFQEKAAKSVKPTEPLPDGTTPLIQAVFKDKPEMVNALLKLDACEVDAESQIGTALGVATALKRDGIVEILQAAGAEKDVFHSEG